MQDLTFLNSKTRREFVERLQRLYAFKGDLKGHLLIGGNEKVYLLEDSELVRSGQDKELRIDRAGLKIATVTLGGPRLNIEGSQLIGPNCLRRVLEIDQEHVEHLVKGEDFLLSDHELGQVGNDTGLFIVKSGRDYFGSALIKEGRFLNQLSKIRRVKNFNQ